MKMNKKTTINKVKMGTKMVSFALAGYGVGEIMGAILKDYQPDAKGLKKMLIKLGAAALTGMVIKSVYDYIGNNIDEVFDTVEDTLNKIEERSKEDDEKEAPADA